MLELVNEVTRLVVGVRRVAVTDTSGDLSLSHATDSHQSRAPGRTRKTPPSIFRELAPI